MEKYSTPTHENLSEVFEQFKKAFKQLPLDNCTLESSHHQYLEKESGLHKPSFQQFVAPPGKIFKLSGDFEVETESNDVSLYLNTMPMPSSSLLAKRMAEDPEDYEDTDSPFNSEFFYPKQFFYGQRLAVSVDGFRFGSPWHPNHKKLNADNVEIEIEGPVDAYMEPGYRTIFLEDKKGSEFYSPYRYPDPLAYTVWEYDLARSLLKNIQIEQVDDNLPRPEFEPVYTDLSIYGENCIWVPYSLNTESIREYYKSHGVELTDEEMLQEIRYRRENNGLRVAEDPLRDWWFAKGKALPSLEELADGIESSKGLENIKKIYFEQICNDNKRHESQPNYIDNRYLGRIAIVCKNMPLEQIVNEEQRRKLGKKASA